MSLLHTSFTVFLTVLLYKNQFHPEAFCPSGGAIHVETNLLPATRFDEDELDSAIQGMEVILNEPEQPRSFR